MDCSMFCIFVCWVCPTLKHRKLLFQWVRWSVEPRNQWVSPTFSNKEPWWCRWQTWYFHENPVAMTLLSEGSNLMDEGDLELAKQCVLAWDDSQCFATFWMFSVCGCGWTYCSFCFELFQLFHIISHCVSRFRRQFPWDIQMDEASYMQRL